MGVCVCICWAFQHKSKDTGGFWSKNVWCECGAADVFMASIILATSNNFMDCLDLAHIP